MHLSKVSWILISGLIWFVVGMGLLILGMNFIILKTQLDPMETSSLIAKLTPFSGGREQAALALIVMGLLIGFMKGRYVLVKTVRRVAERILSLHPPVRLSQVYSKGYLLLIGGMVALGISIKWLGIPLEIRGAVDVAIGSALINGAVAYFRLAMAIRKELNHL